MTKDSFLIEQLLGSYSIGGHPFVVVCCCEESRAGLTPCSGRCCVHAALGAEQGAKMMSFQLPLELMLLANLALSLILCLPLPLSKPGITVCRFSTTPVGQGMTAAAFSILMLLMIQPLYDMSNLHHQKEAAAETITHKDRRYATVGMGYSTTELCAPVRQQPQFSKFGVSSFRTWVHNHQKGISLNMRSSRCRSVEASAHLAMFLTATNLALPVINRTLGLVKGQIDDLRQKYEAKSV